MPSVCSDDFSLTCSQPVPMTSVRGFKMAAMYHNCCNKLTFHRHSVMIIYAPLTTPLILILTGLYKRLNHYLSWCCGCYTSSFFITILLCLLENKD